MTTYAVISFEHRKNCYRMKLSWLMQPLLIHIFYQYTI